MRSALGPLSYYCLARNSRLPTFAHSARLVL